MAHYHQATRHYPGQCLSRPMSPNNVTRPQWFKNVRLRVGHSQLLFQTISRFIQQIIPISQRKYTRYTLYYKVNSRDSPQCAMSMTKPYIARNDAILWQRYETAVALYIMVPWQRHVPTLFSTLLKAPDHSLPKESHYPKQCWFIRPYSVNLATISAVTVVKAFQDINVLKNLCHISTGGIHLGMPMLNLSVYQKWSQYIFIHRELKRDDPAAATYFPSHSSGYASKDRDSFTATPRSSRTVGSITRQRQITTSNDFSQSGLREERR